MAKSRIGKALAAMWGRAQAPKPRVEPQFFQGMPRKARDPFVSDKPGPHHVDVGLKRKPGKQRKPKISDKQQQQRARNRVVQRGRMRSNVGYTRNVTKIMRGL
jgi:hypothetical protein